MANVSPVFHQSHCQRGVGVNARRDTYLPLGSRRKRIEKSAVQLNERISTGLTRERANHGALLHGAHYGVPKMDYP